MILGAVRCLKFGIFSRTVFSTAVKTGMDWVIFRDVQAVAAEQAVPLRESVINLAVGLGIHRSHWGLTADLAGFVGPVRGGRGCRRSHAIGHSAYILYCNHRTTEDATYIAYDHGLVHYG